MAHDPDDDDDTELDSPYRVKSVTFRLVIEDDPNPRRAWAYYQSSDVRRRFEDGRVHFVGVVAIATVTLSLNEEIEIDPDVTIEVRSTGRWGLDSLAGEAFFRLNYEGELRELARILASLGIGPKKFATPIPAPRDDHAD